MDTSDPIYTLGLGTARLAATDILTQQGQSVVLARGSRVGELAKSIKYQSFILDYVSHCFFTNIASASVLKWDEVLGKEQGTNIKNFTKFYK